MSRRERKKRRLRHRGHPAKRIALMTFGLASCALVVGLLAAVGWVVAVADSAPNISDLKPRSPHPPTAIYAADGTLLGYVHTDVLSEPVSGAQIPQTLKDATVAIEDRRFFQHGALDYQGILRAGIKDVFGGGSSVQGASTLTMQLVDNEYISPQIRAERNLKYKIIQAKLAEQLESKHKKMWILNSYLNDAPYGTVNGETARGVGAASEIFFNEPVNQPRPGADGPAGRAAAGAVGVQPVPRPPPRAAPPPRRPGGDDAGPLHHPPPGGAGRPPAASGRRATPPSAPAASPTFSTTCSSSSSTTSASTRSSTEG